MGFFRNNHHCSGLSLVRSASEGERCAPPFGSAKWARHAAIRHGCQHGTGAHRTPHYSLCDERRRRFNTAMSQAHRVPTALTIAGSDSGGGAGIQADLKTFAALGVHGTSAITCLTAQNPSRVLDVQAARPHMVRQQMEAVFAELPPAAVKTGLLHSAEIIRVVAAFFRAPRRP